MDWKLLEAQQSEYARLTYNSTNRLRRLAHRKRIEKTLNFIPATDPLRLLDFGCGDGLFLNLFNEIRPSECLLLGYEPFLDQIPGNSIPVVKDWRDVLSRKPFNCITCLEVMEHFNRDTQSRFIADISSVLSNAGFLIISVPVEKGLPALVKNIVRRIRTRDRTLYSFKNLFRSFWGKPFPEIRNRAGYIFQHMGFYFKNLEPLFVNDFEIVKKVFTPFPCLGSRFNSQVFYLLKKKPL